MNIAVVAWGENVRGQALKAFSALGLINCREMELWVFGPNSREECLKNLPYSKVIILEGFGNLYRGTGQFAREFLKLARERKMVLTVFPDNEKGRELAVRVSIGLGTGAALKVTCIKERAGEIFLERKVYGCNLDGCFRAPQSSFAITFDNRSVEESGETGMPCILHRQVTEEIREELVCCEEKELPPNDSLEHAKRLVVAGRGAISGNTVEMLRELGHLLGAGLGLTRPAALEAMLPYSNMIGMSGVIAGPQLGMVFGASGSAPFMVGLKDSTALAAINNNPDAAIFQSCDFGVVDDAGEFAKAFLEVVREEEGNQ